MRLGVCVQATIIRDGSGKSRGFGFVQFTSVDSVAVAVGASPHQLDADNRVGGTWTACVSIYLVVFLFEANSSVQLPAASTPKRSESLPKNLY